MRSRTSASTLRGPRPPASLRGHSRRGGCCGVHCSPGASAPGLIAGFMRSPVRVAVGGLSGGLGPRPHCGLSIGEQFRYGFVVALRGPRPPASLREGTSEDEEDRHPGDSPGASAPGLIAGCTRPGTPRPRRGRLSGGLGPRPHCGSPNCGFIDAWSTPSPGASAPGLIAGVQGGAEPDPAGADSPGASAPGLIAGTPPSTAPDSPAAPLRGPRPPASLRAGMAARSRPGWAPLSGGLGPRPHCGITNDVVDAVSTSPLSGGLGPRPHCGRECLTAHGMVELDTLRGPRPPASLRGQRSRAGRTPIRTLRGPRPPASLRGHVAWLHRNVPTTPLRGPRPPASLRGHSLRRRRPVDGMLSGGLGPRPHCGVNVSGTHVDRCWSLRGPRPPASLRANLFGVGDARRRRLSPGASAPGLIAGTSPITRPPSSPPWAASPGASAPGLIAGTVAAKPWSGNGALSGGLGPRPHCGPHRRNRLRRHVVALRGPRPPASLRGQHRRRCRAVDVVLSGGLGPRPHCGP